MRGTVAAAEMANFGHWASAWWDPGGPAAALHALNPLRLSHFMSVMKQKQCSTGPFRILDVGCGGGLLSEPLARLGYSVLGIDSSEAAVAAARRHKDANPIFLGLDLNYECTTVEDLASQNTVFDIVVASEVIEHTDNPSLFVSLVSKLLK
ncbi:unnamed protein product, partial [Sphagnum compactum]